MTFEEAVRHAIGYAEGHADASGTPTAHVNPTISGKSEFARAYALGHDALRIGSRTWMPELRQAYGTWQETGGRTIYEQR